jgi:hypothetical protein
VVNAQERNDDQQHGGREREGVGELPGHQPNIRRAAAIGSHCRSGVGAAALFQASFS